jgi:hypothetical protein
LYRLIGELMNGKYFQSNLKKANRLIGEATYRRVYTVDKVLWNHQFCEGPMFVDFMGTLTHKFTSLPTCTYFFFNLHKHDKYCPTCIIYQSPTKLCSLEQVKSPLPMNIDIHELKWFHTSTHVLIIFKSWKFNLCAVLQWLRWFVKFRYNT